MTDQAPLEVVPVADKIKTALVGFFRSLGRDIDEINNDTDLIKSTGAVSEDGVDFACDLSKVLGVTVPAEVNPFVHSSGNRGMKFRELVEYSERLIASVRGGGHGS